MRKINRRAIYLINPKFQLRVALFISSLVVIIGLVYPFIIYEMMRQFIELGIPNIKNAYSVMDENSATFIRILVAIHIGFFLLTFVICIFQGHKIAGPMYHLKKYLSEIRDGGEIRPLTFRKNDHFQDIAQVVNETIEYLSQKNKDK